MTDCATDEALSGVEATTHLHGGYGEEDHHETTDAKGNFSITLNAPDDASVTVTLTKSGYTSWSHRYDGEPKEHVTICLEPSAPGPAPVP